MDKAAVEPLNFARVTERLEKACAEYSDILQRLDDFSLKLIGHSASPDRPNNNLSPAPPATTFLHEFDALVRRFSEQNVAARASLYNLELALNPEQVAAGAARIPGGLR